MRGSAAFTAWLWTSSEASFSFSSALPGLLRFEIVLELGPQHLLVELPDAGLRHRFDEGDVVGAEPAVREAVAAGRVVVVAADDPRAAHLELSQRAAVPGDRAAGFVHAADLHPWHRRALKREHAVLLVLAPFLHVAAQAG